MLVCCVWLSFIVIVFSYWVVCVVGCMVMSFN